MATAELVLGENQEPAVADEALIRRAQAGEVEATEALIERYYPRVWSFVSYLTAGKRDADDLTQEVFLKALGALDRFNGRYRVGPWLLRIARNLIIDESRKDPHRPQATDPADLPELERRPAVDDVWDLVNAGFSRSAVHRAIASLPERQRSMLVLREVEGLSYADIAQTLGTNVRGVEGTLRRARRRFRLEMVEAEEHQGRRAVCHRTLKLVASAGEVTGEARAHLKGCEECRERADRTASAEKALPALAPFVTAPPRWREQIIDSLKPESGRGVIEVFRGGGGWLSSATSSLIEMAASVLLAAAIAGAPVAGSLARSFRSQPPDPLTQAASGFEVLSDELAQSIAPASTDLAIEGPADDTAPSAGSDAGSDSTGEAGLDISISLPLEVTTSLADRYLADFTNSLPAVELGVEDELVEVVGDPPLVDDIVSPELPAADLQEPLEEELPVTPDATVTVVSPLALPRRRFKLF